MSSGAIRRCGDGDPHPPTPVPPPPAPTPPPPLPLSPLLACPLRPTYPPLHPPLGNSWIPPPYLPPPPPPPNICASSAPLILSHPLRPPPTLSLPLVTAAPHSFSLPPLPPPSTVLPAHPAPPLTHPKLLTPYHRISGAQDPPVRRSSTLSPIPPDDCVAQPNQLCRTRDSSTRQVAARARRCEGPAGRRA